MFPVAFHIQAITINEFAKERGLNLKMENLLRMSNVLYQVRRRETKNSCRNYKSTRFLLLEGASDLSIMSVTLTLPITDTQQGNTVWFGRDGKANYLTVVKRCTRAGAYCLIRMSCVCMA
jgi:hypothetical protein